MILNKISTNIYKTPTNMEPNPLEIHRKLAVAMALYRLGHGCSFWVICNLFGVSIGSAIATFSKILQEMVSQFFNEYIYTPMSEEEWIAECKRKKYEFPCVGSWDGYNLHLSTHLKNYYSFKYIYTTTNMGLIG